MFTDMEQVTRFFEQRKKLGIKPGLKRINTLLHLLNNPQDEIKAIHVAGTNGKGSTIGFIKNALVFNGYKVGVFTSPSMEGLTGHILCNDRKISDDHFLDLFNSMHPAIKQLDNKNNNPTEFEIITALAFFYFARNVDIALIETGMGGLKDTTNCFQPILSIITTIDKDHTSFLGETIVEIAHHKAGIIKKNVPVITGEITKEAYSVIHQVAIANQATRYQLKGNFKYNLLKQRERKQVFTWSTNSFPEMEVTIQMLGEHQVKNCSLALMGLYLLQKKGFIIQWDLALEGLAAERIPGRFEIIHENPTIVLDGAHNPAGINSFLNTIEMHYKNVQKHLIFAAFKDKEIAKMLGELPHIFSSVTLTTFDHPRAARAETLYKLVQSNHKYIRNDWTTMINDIVKRDSVGDSYYFITGSLHFIANVRKYILNR